MPHPHATPTHYTASVPSGLTEKEPAIYHGYTLTTKIPFRDVVHAINVSRERGVARARARDWNRAAVKPLDVVTCVHC